MLKFVTKTLKDLDVGTTQKFLMRYLNSPLSKDLMYFDEESIRFVVDYMTKKLKKYARDNSKGEPRVATRNSMFYLPGVNPLKLSTNGTRTGHIATYYVWEEAYHKIEEEFHYEMISKEYSIKRPAKVFSFLLGRDFHQKGTDLLMNKIPRVGVMRNHGINNVVSYASQNDFYYNDRPRYFQQVYEFLTGSKFDILLTSGPLLSSLLDFIKKNNAKDKICTLMSNTGEGIFPEDVAYLKENGLIDLWCDHMRCWDGGASFFTCPYGTYHLMDNISHSASRNGKLICTDYFSLAMPFVNYWNGDYAEIAEDYQKCLCGRFYRKFKFLKQREFSAAGITSDEVSRRATQLGIRGIKYINMAKRRLDVVSFRELKLEERALFERAFPEYQILFHVER